MQGVVFGEMLRRHWRGMLLWGSGFGLIVLARFSALADDETLEQVTNLIETLPPFFANAFLGGDAGRLATPMGYIAVQVFIMLLLFLSGYAAVLGLNVTANDEDRGILDVQMSLPITRARLMLEKLAAFTLLLLGAMVQILFWSWVAVQLTPSVDIDMGAVVVGMLNAIPGTLFVLAVTTLLAVLVRRRSLAIGLVFGFVLVSYIANLIGEGAPDSIFGQFRLLSYFTYYDGVNVVLNGLNVGNVAVLLGVTVLAAGGALVLWQRRDIGV